MADEWNEIELFALCYISRIHYHENLPDVCELHRSFVKFIDLILSDAEAPSFAIGNDPGLLHNLDIFLDCNVDYHFVYFTDRSVMFTVDELEFWVE